VRSEAKQLLGGLLLADLTDPQTEEIIAIFLATDNGPCFNSHGFARDIGARPRAAPHPPPPALTADQRRGRRYHGAINVEAL
jgi:hypothetical protein